MSLRRLWSQVHSQIFPQGFVDWAAHFFAPLVFSPTGPIFVHVPVDLYDEGDQLSNLNGICSSTSSSRLRDFIADMENRYQYLFGGDVALDGEGRVPAGLPAYVANAGKITSILAQHLQKTVTARSPWPSMRPAAADLFAQMALSGGNFADGDTDDDTTYGWASVMPYYAPDVTGTQPITMRRLIRGHLIPFCCGKGVVSSLLLRILFSDQLGVDKIESRLKARLRSGEVKRFLGRLHHTLILSLIHISEPTRPY